MWQTNDKRRQNRSEDNRPLIRTGFIGRNNDPMSDIAADSLVKGAGIVESKPIINPWIIAVTVTLATFMELLDTSIANVSLPHIAGGLSTGQDESTWVLSSYLVANAVVLPLSAWLSRLLGRKNYYMLSVGLFTVSSLLCGLAPSLSWLIFFRVMQGIGGGRTCARRTGDFSLTRFRRKNALRHLRFTASLSSLHRQ